MTDDSETNVITNNVLTCGSLALSMAAQGCLHGNSYSTCSFLLSLLLVEMVTSGKTLTNAKNIQERSKQESDTKQI
jgi:hypothetical protein